MNIFKIRNKKTGQFSSGGHYPIWEKLGIVYYSLSKARNTAKQVRKHRAWSNMYDDDIAEIIEFDLVEVNRIPISEN